MEEELEGRVKVPPAPTLGEPKDRARQWPELVPLGVMLVLTGIILFRREDKTRRVEIKGKSFAKPKPVQVVAVDAADVAAAAFATGGKPGRLSRVQDSDGGVRSVATTADGVTYAVRASDGALVSWKTGKSVAAVASASEPLADVAATIGAPWLVGLAKSGRVYVWHAETGALLADGVLPGGDKVSHVAAGGQHIVMLTETGQVYTCGANGNGQLGTGSRSNVDVAHPVPVSLPGTSGKAARVRRIAAGSRHTLLLAKDGSVWSFGHNGCMQCGQGDATNGYYEENVLTPQRVVGVAAASDVTCGREHSMVVQHDGTVVAFGANGVGQLGTGKIGHVNNVQKVDLDAPIAKLTCQDGHCAALTAAGGVLTWGENRYGQIGTGRRVSQKKPVRVAQVDGGLRNVTVSATARATVVHST